MRDFFFDGKNCLKSIGQGAEHFKDVGQRRFAEICALEMPLGHAWTRKLRPGNLLMPSNLMTSNETLFETNVVGPRMEERLLELVRHTCTS